MNLKEYSAFVKERVDSLLTKKLNAKEDLCKELKEAMHYALMLGGKRSRPFLVYASAKALGYDESSVDNAACAIECIHAYSLVHDDMPEMDNDDLRRGHLSVHKKFSQETALLVGDALQALAFDCLSDGENAQQVHYQLKVLANLAGINGMCGGQALDLYYENKKDVSLDELYDVHKRKTGALIVASCLMGASVVLNNTSILNQFEAYAKDVGVAFQIWDDVLDVIGDTKILGKKVGSDISLNKSTYVSLMGLEAAKKLAVEKAHLAISKLENLEHSQLLKEFAMFCVQRDH